VSTLRTASVWLIAIALVLVLTAFLFALTAAQLTGEASGQVILRRSTAVITDLDQSIPEIEQELHETADASDEETVLVPGFPIPVELPRDEAAELEGEALRNRILDDSADVLYDDGQSAWAANDEDAVQDIERLSASGLVYHGLGLIQDPVHLAFLAISILLGALAVIMVAMLLFVLPRDARVLVLSMVTLAAALPTLAAAVGLRFAFRTLETDDDAFVDGMMAIGADSMWVPIRNAFTLTVLGGCLLLLGSLYIWWEARSLKKQGRMADTGALPPT
jgi:hypothetical protein